MRWQRKSLLVALALTFAVPCFAVQPDEILADPVLESRARNLSEGLRCLVCQNQSIDASDAPLARDLRILIREQLVSHKSDAEVMDFVVARYGEYVLLKPPLNPRTYLLWSAPFVLLIVAGAALFRRGKQGSEPLPPLSVEEEKRLKQVLAGTQAPEKPQ
jgi:cytochrome c-type biogenesis protein CcmH